MAHAHHAVEKQMIVDGFFEKKNCCLMIVWKIGDCKLLVSDSEDSVLRQHPPPPQHNQRVFFGSAFCAAWSLRSPQNLPKGRSNFLGAAV